jgi:hypothetical protein
MLLNIPHALHEQNNRRYDATARLDGIVTARIETYGRPEAA